MEYVKVEKTYTHEDVSKILTEMKDYLEYCSAEDNLTYFNELVDTELFADACGKIIDAKGNQVEVEAVFKYNSF